MAPPRSFTIRVASPDQTEAILHCLHTAFEPFRSYYTPAGYSDTTLDVHTLRQRFTEMSIYVALTPDDIVIGTIACNIRSSEEGHLRGMAVLPDQQGEGIAEALLETAEAELKRAGCTRVTLGTTAPLQRAIRFYEKHGYRRTGNIGDHFGMPLYEFEKSVSRS